MGNRSLTVLILDDDEAVRESFVCYFEDRGWLVLSAASGEEAFNVLRHKAPDGAIVDIRLPGMSGSTLIHDLSSTHPALACVICTGSPEYRLPADIRSLPQVAGQVIAKPVEDLAHLESALRRQIELCREKREAP